MSKKRLYILYDTYNKEIWAVSNSVCELEKIIREEGDGPHWLIQPASEFDPRKLRAFLSDEDD